jgi:acyl-CoA thioesterase FadM
MSKLDFIVKELVTANRIANEDIVDSFGHVSAPTCLHHADRLFHRQFRHRQGLRQSHLRASGGHLGPQAGCWCSAGSWACSRS